MTIGFELETNLDLGVRLDRDLIASDYLDPRLGHIEADGSISGVEFNSHIFTWKMLQKIKPLFEAQFASTLLWREASGHLLQDVKETLIALMLIWIEAIWRA